MIAVLLLTLLLVIALGGSLMAALEEEGRE